MIITVKNKNTLILDDFEFKCCVGKSGITNHKIEGDKKTPKGTFSIGPLYYRKDRNTKPTTKLTIKEIKKNMGWCDDVYHKKYNKLIKVNETIKHEKLFRKDHKYDYIITIDHNKKNIPNKGSAIFLHLTTNYNPTAGCIALKKKDFEILIKLIDKNTKIKIN